MWLYVHLKSICIHLSPGSDRVNSVYTAATHVLAFGILSMRTQLTLDCFIHEAYHQKQQVVRIPIIISVCKIKSYGNFSRASGEVK